ncbi:universal stress protein [Reinekea thalattae]|uniref:Universal stress protein n=1 Tax=Reinekea thalattae TaxID=2593301 RepID=A0A5C8ZBB0_9GAMM|nr:universal stress protein [Reinekea thalattae]TXR54443.1 universal stress protein [Reinekea thalattae]
MYQTIVAPVDISEKEMSEKILQMALFHLQHSHCQVHLLMVTPATASDEEVEKLSVALMAFTTEHIDKQDGKKDSLKMIIKKGAPSDQILSYATEVKADLIILGRHRTAANVLGRPALGSTTVKVSSQASADICIVKNIA